MHEQVNGDLEPVSEDGVILQETEPSVRVTSWPEIVAFLVLPSVSQVHPSSFPVFQVLTRSVTVMDMAVIQ